MNTAKGHVSRGQIPYNRKYSAIAKAALQQIFGCIRIRRRRALRDLGKRQFDLENRREIGIQPQICCNRRGPIAAYLRLYGNSRERRTQRPGQTALLLRRFLNNGYTTANLLQIQWRICSKISVVWECRCDGRFPRLPLMLRSKLASRAHVAKTALSYNRLAFWPNLAHASFWRA